jgi:hypothetical protein
LSATGDLDGDELPENERALAFLDGVEALVYEDEPTEAQRRAIGVTSPNEAANMAAALVANMQLVFTAITSTGIEVEPEWAVGYSFRSLRAKLLDQPAPRLLPEV